MEPYTTEGARMAKRRRRKIAAAADPATAPATTTTRRRARRKAPAAAAADGINGNRVAAAATKLEHAILDDGRSKRDLSMIARIPEVKFGKIAKGKLQATPDEKRSIASVLNRSISALFSVVGVVFVAL